ncbi:M57 family metalloprotease [Chitinophaga sp. Hz27]|uniref:M57 family metalloprotease n=1 Tax=Chitinophaga sp. Hz27 TaxID=3347169 RepID=UPI0035DEC111
MNKFVRLTGIPSVAVALLLSACSKNDLKQTPQSIPNATAEEITAMKSYLSKTTAVGESKIVFNDARQTFMVDGDMVFPVGVVKDYMKSKPATSGSPTTEQYRYQWLLSDNVVKYIRIKDNIANADWKVALRDAIRRWNNYSYIGSSTKITFVIYSDNVACDLVAADNINVVGGEVVNANMPKANGATGDSLKINTSYNTLTAEKKAFALTHALGHILGLTHSDGGSGTLIPNTPVTDTSSIMSPTIPAIVPANFFTSGDLYAVRYLYPRTQSWTGTTSRIDSMGGIDIATDDGCWYWGQNVVTRGNSSSIYGESNYYQLIPGKTANDIVDIGIANTNIVYAWYKDGTVSNGGFLGINTYPFLNSTYSYSVPPGKTYASIVGISINKTDGRCYAWYNDGTYSVGTSSNLGYYQDPAPYTVPAGKSFSDIKAVGIAQSSQWCYFWYKDNTVSTGSVSNAALYQALYPITN